MHRSRWSVAGLIVGTDSSVPWLFEEDYLSQKM